MYQCSFHKIFYKEIEEKQLCLHLLIKPNQFESEDGNLNKKINHTSADDLQRSKRKTEHERSKARCTNGNARTE